MVKRSLSFEQSPTSSLSKSPRTSPPAALCRLCSLGSRYTPSLGTFLCCMSGGPQFLCALAPSVHHGQTCTAFEMYCRDTFLLEGRPGTWSAWLHSCAAKLPCLARCRLLEGDQGGHPLSSSPPSQSGHEDLSCCFGPSDA